MSYSYLVPSIEGSVCCVCVFIELHIIARSDPVVLVILCCSHCSFQGVLRDQCCLLRKPLRVDVLLVIRTCVFRVFVGANHK